MASRTFNCFASLLRLGRPQIAVRTPRKAPITRDFSSRQKKAASINMEDGEPAEINVVVTGGAVGWISHLSLAFFGNLMLFHLVTVSLLTVVLSAMGGRNSLASDTD
jgi:hypothetical protein